MQNYFINTGRERQGPFGAEDLLRHGLRRETLVWRDGFTDWMSAGDVPELAELLRNSAPAFKSFGIDTAIPADYKKQETRANWNAVIWTIILTAILILILWIVLRNRSSSNPDPADRRSSPAGFVALQ